LKIINHLVTAPNGGTARDYQDLSASFGCMAILVMARRSVGSPVYLCIPRLQCTSSIAADRAVEMARSWKANLDPPLRTSASRAPRFRF
jgi:hypothetical protein